jgi:hypothetical protein
MKAAVSTARAQMDLLLDSLMSIARLMQIWQLPLMIPITIGLLGMLTLAYTFIFMEWIGERVKL